MSDPIPFARAGSDDLCLFPEMANRHGLIAGATGTGKTVTLQTLAESFSRRGIPVFLADVKGDLSGLGLPGGGSAKAAVRRSTFGGSRNTFSCGTVHEDWKDPGESMPMNFRFRQIWLCPRSAGVSPRLSKG
jgi:hypothetical protein